MAVVTHLETKTNDEQNEYSREVGKVFKSDFKNFVAYLQKRGVTRLEAEEIVQEAFTRILTRLQSPSTSNIEGIVYGYMKNILHEYRRQKSVRPVFGLLDEIAEFSPAGERIQLEELKSAIYNELSQLNPREKAIWLGILQGIPTLKIAKELGVSQRTVQNDFKRVRQKVRDRFFKVQGYLSQ